MLPRWCTYSSYCNLIKFDAIAGAGPLEAAEKVLDNFLPSFIVGSLEFVDASI